MDITGLMTSIGGSGILTVGYGMLSRRRAEKRLRIKHSLEERREPLVQESMALQNAREALEIVKEALDAAVDAKMQLATELRTTKADLQEQINSLSQEADRLRRREAERDCNLRDKESEVPS